MHIKVTVTNNLQKREILLTYRGKLPRKKLTFFVLKIVTFHTQQLFLTKYFTRRTHFSK